MASADGPEAGQALSDAAYAGDTARIGDLLASGTVVNAPDQDGFTALHRSCVTGNLEVIQYLLDAGAEVNAEDSYGDSPMHYACFCGHVEAVHTLLRAGADPNKRSKDGKTPIDSAREEGHEAVVSLLTGGEPGGSKVAGLDFSHGVIIEGELKKKRANVVIKWRKKYYVFSRIYGAMFFWTGSKSTVEGVIKKVRFETFLSVKQLTKYGGKRFDLRVITGRRMRLLASSASEAKRWVDTIKQHLGPLMAVLRVQTAWRVYRARLLLRRMIAERQAAVKRLVAHAGDLGTVADADGVVYEGPLRKKNSRGLGRVFTAFRTRYFVLNLHDAALYYYESKAKRTLGVRPRAIPFLSFYSVTQELDKKGKPTKKFQLRVVSGRVFQFEGKNDAEATAWVTHINSVLPRDNVAAVKIQSVVRMRLAKVFFQSKLRDAESLKTEIEAKYGGTAYEDLSGAATKIQALRRGHVIRVKAAAERAAKEAADKKMADVKSRRLWFRKRHGEEGGDAAATDSPAKETTAARLKRLKELKAKKKLKAWEAHQDEASGKTYWHNSETGESTWEDPFAAASAGEGAEETKAEEPKTEEPKADTPDEDPWDVAQDADGNTFFTNRVTGESVWDKPENFREWVEEIEPETGKTFYFNRITRESSWDRPLDFVKVIGDWEERANEDGALYYFNRVRGESVWEKPPEFGVVTAAVVEEYSGDKKKSAPDHDDNWRMEIDPSSNKPYWFNVVTQESVWTKPGSDTTVEDPLDVDLSEVLAFSSWVNSKLENGTTGRGGGHLPLELESATHQILYAIRSGVLLCHLINAVVPDTVDERVLSTDAVPGEGSAAQENLQLCISAAQSIGAVLGGISAADLESGKPVPVMDVIWQIMKIDLMEGLSVKKAMSKGSGKGLLRLLNDSEEVSDLLQLTPEKVLLRWLNFQAGVGGHSGTVDGFGDSLKDGVVLAALVRAVAADYSADIPATDAECKELEPADLVARVLGAAFGAGVPPWFSVEAITSSNLRLQLGFVASLFAVAPNLADDDAEESSADGTSSSAATGSSGAGTSATGAGAGGSKSGARSRAPRFTVSSVQVAKLEKDLAELIKEEEADENDTRESRTMKQWLNSLNLPKVFVHDLFQDVRDGVTLLKTLDHIEPGIVRWKRVNQPRSPDVPLNRYKRVENCNYVVELCRAMEFSLVNLAGLDIVDGNPKLALALLWQMMRSHTLKILSSIGDGFEMAEEDIIAWANAKVEAESPGKGFTMKSFQDPSLSSGVFLMHLLNSVRGIVNWSLVTRGRTESEKRKNLQYLISVARKMGVTVFCSWEDILAVRPKMIMTLVASVMVVDKKLVEEASRSAGGARAGAGGEDLGAIGEEEEYDSDF